MKLPGLKPAQTTASTKKPKLPPPEGPVDVWCRRWMGISIHHTTRIIVLGMLAGAAMETFMIKAWIGQTNFYETVKKKEAEKRIEKRKQDDGPNFADILKQQWEEKKREMEQQSKDSGTR